MSKRPELEIGQSVGALLVGGPLHGQNCAVRLGLNGLPRYLEFPDARHLRVEFGFPRELFDRPEPDIRSVKYVLYDDWPVRYLHLADWGSDDDNDGPREFVPDPTPGMLA